MVIHDGQDKRKTYDCTTTAGLAATQLLKAWSSNKSDKMSAPWRQEVEGGQYGNHKWVQALQDAFSPLGGDKPEFSLWQLALADHTVRPPNVSSGGGLTPPRAPQASSLLEPCNANAVYWLGYDSGATRRGNHMGDTEAGTKAWMETLKAALKGADPPPTAYPDSDGATVHTLALTVTDFTAADAPLASQPVLLGSQPPRLASQ